MNILEWLIAKVIPTPNLSPVQSPEDSEIVVKVNYFGSLFSH